jgi:hypothetical protein
LIWTLTTVLALAAVVLGAVPAHADATLPTREGPPAQIASFVACQPQDYASSTGRVLFVEACLERLPGGVRAHFTFAPLTGTVNIKGTLHTCTLSTCLKSTPFNVTGIPVTGRKVATAWATTCPTTNTWWGYIRLLDIRFMPSGELRAGTTGPPDGFSGYDSLNYTTNAC